jgi:hypothetical protein
MDFVQVKTSYQGSPDGSIDAAMYCLKVKYRVLS